MGNGKRNPAIVVSSSDDDDKDDDFLLKTSYRFSELASNRNKPKRAKTVSFTSSSPRPSSHLGANGFDEVKRICEEFDQGFIQFKVTSGKLTNLPLSMTAVELATLKYFSHELQVFAICSSCNTDLWVEKYKPNCLEELAVHKKKVEEVRMWFEERLRNSVGNSASNVILVSGPAGVGKSATIHAIARHLGVEVREWSTPTPTIWKEHLHNSNSGIQYMSKLDEFESFVERIRKYGLVSSSLTSVYPLPIILLVDDLPVVNGKVSYGRLQKCLHLLLQSVGLPTAILLSDCGRSESTEHNSRYWEELQLALQNAGACKVTFNTVTANSIKRVLKKICREEKFEASDEHIDYIAKASGGDIRHAITSLQYVSLKPHPMHFSSVPKWALAYPDERENWSSHFDDGVSLSFGKDATLSLFHALGKFLHNKREIRSLVTSDRNAILLNEKLVRCPLKMDSPESVLSQAHGQARLIADFLHENVLDFVSEEAIDDACVIGRYLSDTDLFLAPSNGALSRNFEVGNFKQSIAASVAVRGVLFGNSYPVSSRWHAIRRPMLWQVEQSLLRNKWLMLSHSGDARNISVSRNNHLVFATEYKPMLNWLGDRVPEDAEGQGVLNEVDSTEDDYQSMSLDEDNVIDDNDEIEDW